MAKLNEVADRKELKDILRKCRCCLRLIIDDRRAVGIDDAIRNQFFELTNLELLKIDAIDRICQLCASDLETFSNLRSDLIEKQNSLYDLLGLKHEVNPQSSSSIVEEVVPFDKQEKHENLAVEYEFVEEEDDDEMMEEPEYLWEETVQADDDDDGSESIREVEIEEEEPSTYILATDDDDDEGPKVAFRIERIESAVKRSKEEMDQQDSSDFLDYLEEYNTSINDEELTGCDLCGIYIVKSKIDLHSEIMHVDCRCNECDKDFPSKILLKKHEKNAHAVNHPKGLRIKRKVHFCGLCEKEYEYRKHLDDHIRSYHNKERDKQCPICNKMFYHRDIKKHIEHVHGEKNIQCKVCGKLYACLENLKLHARYHDEPKYICTIEGCGKKFHQKILWEHHLLKHSTVKNIECQMCGNSFYTARDLNRHTLRVHNKVTRKCFSCESTFYRKDKYREHIIKQHKELSEEERASVLDSIRALKWNENDLNSELNITV